MPVSPKDRDHSWPALRAATFFLKAQGAIARGARILGSKRSGAIAIILSSLVGPLAVVPAHALTGATLQIINPGKYGVVGSVPPTNYGNPSTALQSLVMAPVCPEDAELRANSLYCIAGITFESPETGEMVPAVFDGYVTPSNGGEVASMPGNPSAGLPAGRSMTRWDLPGLPGSTGKTTYLLSAGLDLEIDPTSGMWGPTSINGNPPTTVFFQPYDYSAPTDACMFDESNARVWWDGAGCAQVVDYAQDVRVQLTMVVPKYVGGWFAGRMGAPEIQLNDLSATSNLLEITASTVSVPESPAITANQEMLDAVFGAGIYELDGNDGYATIGLEFGKIPLIAPFVDDAPQKIERRWNFTQYPDAAGACYTGAGQLQAFSTTDAMQYQPSAPEFDPTTGQFSFKVSGFHYEADKSSVAAGSYDFVVRRDILDCLYGFDAASEIVGLAEVRDGGVSQPGVSVESAPNSDMVRISLRGFHFSTPETLIRFEGDVSTLQRFAVTPTPVMSSGIRVGAAIKVSTEDWDPAATLTYQWYLNGVEIAGADEATYTPTKSQFNRLLSVTVRGSKTGYLTSSQSSIGKLVGSETGFSDVPPGRAFEKEIAWLAETGITNGYSDGTFRPLGTVNRDAMAAFLYRFAGKPAFTPPQVSPFSDVTSSTPFYKEITWLASTGITGGFTDGTFRPLGKVNRDAMAAFLYRFAGKPAFPSPTKSPFPDVTSSTPFYKEITWLASTGITGGFNDGTFRPLATVNRDAMAAFLYRFDAKGLAVG